MSELNMDVIKVEMWLARPRTVWYMRRGYVHVQWSFKSELTSLLGGTPAIEYGIIT